jgi:hypothetical protein
MPPAMTTPGKPDSEPGQSPGRRSGQEPVAASEAQTVPLTLFMPTIETGSEVKVRSPRAGEGGTWSVIGQVANSSPDAYDVTHTHTGRRRVFRGSRLKVVRGPAPRPNRGRSR